MPITPSDIDQVREYLGIRGWFKRLFLDHERKKVIQAHKSIYLMPNNVCVNCAVFTWAEIEHIVEVLEESFRIRGY